MFQKKSRQSLAVYLHYNRDVKRLRSFGDVAYHSRRMRYVLLYIDQEKSEAILTQLKKEKFVKKVVPSYMQDMDHNFVGILYRNETQSLQIPEDLK